MMSTIPEAKPAIDAPAGAGTLAELNVEARTVLAFRVRDEALNGLLPEGWQAAPIEGGPSKGANLNLIFTDRLLVQQADGQPLPGQATNQLAVIALPAVHPQTGARCVVIAMGLSARAEGAPGPYGVFEPAEVDMERLVRTGPEGARVGEEQWHFRGGSGEQLRLRLQYAAGVPGRSSSDTTAYSAKNPGFYRVYRADQGAVVLQGNGVAPDATLKVDFGAMGPRLGRVLDGSQQLVSVLSVPWTVRRAFVP